MPLVIILIGKLKEAFLSDNNSLPANKTTRAIQPAT